MRTKKSMINMAAGFFGQLLNLILAVAGRSILARYMPSEYLGINGLFSNVLSILSLADLGIGAAMMYALYSPVARENREEIRRLMNLYRLLYRWVAGAVAVLGLALLPFLDLLVRTDRPIDHMVLIYLLYLAHQNLYICSMYANFFTLVRYGGQIAVLLLTRNFFLYLLVQILCGLLPNILASRRAERMYPYLREDRRSYPDRETAREIFRNVRALFIHKAAGMMVYSVDSILISALVSLGATGVYSNYKLISSNASIGNLVATEGDEDRRHRVFSMLSFSAFLLYSACAVAMLVLFEPFILLCFGGDYLLPRRTVLLLLAQFYITGMRTVIQKFRGAMGLFWYDRYKALAEVAVNLVLSLILARRFGLDGILAATVLDLLLIPFWVDPLVLFRYGWRERRGQRLAGYFLRYLLWTGGMLLAGWGTERVCRLAGGPGFWNLAAKGLTCAVLYGGMLLVLFGWTPECRDLLAYVGSFVRRTRPRAGKV